MSTHIYGIGDTVSLNFHQGQILAKLNPFVVEALMPPVGADLQYRIKSGAENYRRIVSEHQLSSAAPNPNRNP